jgi:hypothetical protein
LFSRRDDKNDLILFACIVPQKAFLFIAAAFALPAHIRITFEGV